MKKYKSLLLIFLENAIEIAKSMLRVSEKNKEKRTKRFFYFDIFILLF